jgi:hypothetical protein
MYLASAVSSIVTGAGASCAAAQSPIDKKERKKENVYTICRMQ